MISKNTLHLQAGAGIVSDSIPENEYQETLNKAERNAESSCFS
jgi:anthranilate synthase component 1